MLYTSVYARKIRLTRRFSFISFIEISKINKRTEYLSRLMGGYLVGDKQLLWSGLTVLSGDALSDSRRFDCSCDLRLPYPYIPDFKHRLQKTLFVGKIIGWKIDLFILLLRIFWGFWIEYVRSLCAGAMILSVLTLAIVGSTSGRCYFLQQCRCLSVCVLCALVVRCMKS